MMKVIGFYTDWKYFQQAEAMKASAESVGLECVLYKRPDRGSWWANCNQKCEVVLEALDSSDGESILYQDADTRFITYPKLFDTLDADMAAFFWSATVPIGGTLWFNGNRSRRYIEQWAK